LTFVSGAPLTFALGGAWFLGQFTCLRLNLGVREVGFVGCGHGWVGFGVACLGRAASVSYRVAGYGLEFAVQRGSSVRGALSDWIRAGVFGFR